MTAFLIGAAECAAITAGQPAVVAPVGLPGLALRVLVPRQGVLRFTDAATEDSPVPLPPGLRPLAILAPDAATAAGLAAGLPAGVPRLIGGNPVTGLVGLLAEALAAANAARLQLQGRPGRSAPAPRQRIIELPPTDGKAPPPRVTQHLGRPAEGICGIALHVAAVRASSASLLRVRLLAGGRVLGAWLLPGQDIAGGWLGLDLPEPAPPGSAEAVLEVAVEAAPGEVLHLSAGAVGGEAPLALRVDAAEPGHLVLPQHFNWAARDLPMMPPGLALPISEAAWQAARIEGADGRLVAAGGEPPRLLLDLPAGSTAKVSLPAVPPGAADLALAELACRLGAADQVQVALRAGPEQAGAMGTGRRDSGWRIPDQLGALRIALPLPAGLGGALAMQIEIRNRGASAVTMEVSMLALLAGAAGTPRQVPASSLLAPSEAARPGTPPRFSVPLPGSTTAPPAVPPPAAPGPMLAPAGLPGPPMPSNPPPPLASIEPGAPLPAEPASPLAMAAPEPPPPATPAEMPPGGADYQDIHLHQHTVNADATYQHIDLSLSGLVSASGVWREIRLKLFDRRGTVGLEFRRIKGWPPMFDVWPQGGTDHFGPFWRLETQATAEAMAKLSASGDRALVAALLEVLPSLARRASRLADLPAEAQEAWSERGRALAQAVEATRPLPPPMVGRVG